MQNFNLMVKFQLPSNLSLDICLKCFHPSSFLSSLQRKVVVYPFTTMFHQSTIFNLLEPFTFLIVLFFSSMCVDLFM